MPYRIIAPYEEGPDISHIEEEPSMEVTYSTSGKGQEVTGSGMSSFDPGDFDQIIKKAKAKRKASRKSSTGKRKSFSLSESGENPAAVCALPDVIPRTVPVEVDALSLATEEIVHGGIDMGDSSTSTSPLSSPTEPPKVHSVQKLEKEQEMIQECVIREAESTPTSPSKLDRASSGLQIPPGIWLSKGTADMAVGKRMKNCPEIPQKTTGKEVIQSRRWQR